MHGLPLRISPHRGIVLDSTLHSAGPPCRRRGGLAPGWAALGIFYYKALSAISASRPAWLNILLGMERPSCLVLQGNSTSHQVCSCVVILSGHGHGGHVQLERPTSSAQEKVSGSQSVGIMAGGRACAHPRIGGLMATPGAGSAGQALTILADWTRYARHQVYRNLRPAPRGRAIGFSLGRRHRRDDDAPAGNVLAEAPRCWTATWTTHARARTSPLCSKMVARLS